MYMHIYMLTHKYIYIDKPIFFYMYVWCTWYGGEEEGGSTYVCVYAVHSELP